MRTVATAKSCHMEPKHWKCTACDIDRAGVENNAIYPGDICERDSEQELQDSRGFGGEECSKAIPLTLQKCKEWLKTSFSEHPYESFS